MAFGVPRRNAATNAAFYTLKVYEMKTYARPALSVHGKVEELTHGMKDGNALDRAYPTNTPKPELTFS